MLPLFACWLLSGWGGPARTAVVRDCGAPVFSAFAFACAVVAARSFRGRRRVAWAITAFGLLGWVLGDLVWAFYRVARGGDPPFPSIADVAFLVMPIAVCVSWLVNTSDDRRPLGRMRPLLDGLIVAAAVFIVSWVTVLRPLFRDRGLSDLQLVTTAAYPVTDIVMVTMAIIITSTVPAAHRLSTGLFTSGLAVIALTDSTCVYLNAHDVRISGGLVIGWAAGVVMIGASALTAISAPRLRLPTGRTPGLPFWLPFVPIPFATALAMYALWSGPPDHTILVAAAVLVAFAVVRRFTMLLENRALVSTMAERRLRDPLTGLANRLSFADRLSSAMRSSHRDGQEVAVLSLNLDDFKLVNDNLGHHQGDLLLALVAERLQTIVPVGDTLARWGGDEFALLLEGNPHPEETAQRVVEVFDKPFFLGGEEVYVHPSVGLAVAPAPPALDALAGDELFQRAALAMDAAKATGIGGVHLYADEMRLASEPEPDAVPGKVGRRQDIPVAPAALLSQLRRAIDQDTLGLAYQPKVSLSTGDIVGVEALIRWNHPELGPLTPNQFLPLVRRIGLMGALTDVVVNRAARDAVTWWDAADCAVPVAINLFAPLLDDLSLPDRIAATLARVGLPAAALSVEITEHLLLGNIGRADMVIERLRAIGVAIAIDDFGSGYSTMSYLRDLNIDEVKLDRHFVAPILASQRAAAIVQSVIGLAHTLGIVCVAEGVEDRSTATRLRDYGCDIAQGHYFAQPVPADVLRETYLSGRNDPARFTVGS